MRALICRIVDRVILGCRPQQVADRLERHHARKTRDLYGWSGTPQNDNGKEKDQ